MADETTHRENDGFFFARRVKDRGGASSQGKDGMADCERFEIAIEQRRRGALAADELAPLDEHLAICAGCAAFDRLGRTTEETMKSVSNEVVQATDWARIEERFATWQRRLNVSVGRMILGGLVGAAAAIAAMFAINADTFREPAGLVPSILVPLAVVMGMTWQLKRRAVREGREAQMSRGALLSVFRQQLDERIQLEATARWLLPLMMTVILVFELVSGESMRRLLGIAAVVTVMYGVSLNSHFRVLPRLRRQRAELD